MKICIIIEDKPDGGVRSQVVRQTQGRETLSDDTGANLIAQELEQQLDEIMTASRALYAASIEAEQEAARCWH